MYLAKGLFQLLLSLCTYFGILSTPMALALAFDPCVNQKPVVAIGIEWTLFRKAKCLMQSERWQLSLPQWERIHRHPFFQKQPEVLAISVPFLLKRGLLPSYWKLWDLVWTRLETSQMEQDQKEQLASVFVQTALMLTEMQQRSFQHNLFLRLYLEMADTRWSIWLFDTPIGQQWAKKQSFENQLQHAKQLLEHHQNALAISKLESLLQARTSCEARYLYALGLRKTRQYTASAEQAQAVAHTCSGDWKQKGWFLALRVEALRNRLEAIPEMDRFAETYKGHSYVDDVLFWKANLLQYHQHTDAAIQTYESIIAIPSSDMKSAACIQLGLLYAKEGNIPKALEWFDSMRGIQGDGLFKQLYRDQAAYWYGRLLVFPNPQTWALQSDVSMRQKGLTHLKALAEKRYTTYYGFLALLALQEALPTLEWKRWLAKQAFPIKRKQIQAIPIPPLPQTVSIFQTLQKHGLSEEARWWMEWAQPSLSVEEQAIAYDFLGFPHKAHQVLRKNGLAYLEGAPMGPLAGWKWKLAYSKPYLKEMQQSAKQAQVPLGLLFGVSREESQFDHRAISTAGALGLFQLMPSTAKQTMKGLRWPLLSQEELLQPDNNAILGGNVLKQELQTLSHPALAIAAYNAGAPSVKRWLQRYGSCALDWFVEQIPVEQTLFYVKKVTSSWLTYTWMLNDFHLNLFQPILPSCKNKPHQEG